MKFNNFNKLLLLFLGLTIVSSPVLARVAVPLHCSPTGAYCTLDLLVSNGFDAYTIMKFPSVTNSNLVISTPPTLIPGPPPGQAITYSGGKLGITGYYTPASATISYQMVDATTQQVKSTCTFTITAREDLTVIGDGSCTNPSVYHASVGEADGPNGTGLDIAVN